MHCTEKRRRNANAKAERKNIKLELQKPEDSSTNAAQCEPERNESEPALRGAQSEM